MARIGILLWAAATAGLAAMLRSEAQPLNTDVFSSTDLTYLQTALMSQAQLAWGLPLNRILLPALSTRKPIFNYTNYAYATIASLASNSVALGLRRVTLDLWFDPSTFNFQMCPVSYNSSSTLVASNTVAFDSFGALMTTVYCPVASLGLASLLAPFAQWISQNNDMGYREALELIVNLHVAEVNVSASSSTSISATLPTSTSEASLSSATASATDSSALLPTTTTTAAQPSPTPVTTALSSVFSQLFGTFLYTPPMLASDRANVNQSWLAPAAVTGWPDGQIGNLVAYFDETWSAPDAFGVRNLSTLNGWPSLEYLVLNNLRVLVGFGTIDADVYGYYNVSQDAGTIFSSDALVATPPVAYADVVFPMSYCSWPNSTTYMAPTGSETYPGPMPSGPGTRHVSWGFSYVGALAGTLANFTATTLAALVNCGFQPDFGISYQPSSILATIWSWDYLQPEADDDKRCAVMQQSNGRWANWDCQIELPLACQSVTNPHNWTIIVDALYIYYVAGSDEISVCPDGYYFGVPRTPQQNAALYAVLRQHASLSHVWVNFNSILASGCWVFGTDPCPNVSGSTTLSLVLAQTYKEAIGVVCFFGIFIFLRLRQQSQARQQSRRRAEARRRKLVSEYNSLPA